MVIIVNSNLDRFIKAQKNDFEIARQELQNGKKESHWMWYIFPQLKGLGFSYISNYYGIESLTEAKANYDNEYLKSNLNELIKILLNIESNNPTIIFGSPDDLKLKSSMTLFYLATNEKRFKKVLDKYYNGELDQKTLDLLNQL